MFLKAIQVNFKDTISIKYSSILEKYKRGGFCTSCQAMMSVRDGRVTIVNISARSKARQHTVTQLFGFWSVPVCQVQTQKLSRISLCDWTLHTLRLLQPQISHSTCCNPYLGFLVGFALANPAMFDLFHQLPI